MLRLVVLVAPPLSPTKESLWVFIFFYSFVFSTIVSSSYSFKTLNRASSCFWRFYILNSLSSISLFWINISVSFFCFYYSISFFSSSSLSKALILTWACYSFSVRSFKRKVSASSFLFLARILLIFSWLSVNELSTCCWTADSRFFQSSKAFSDIASKSVKRSTSESLSKTCYWSSRS